jgi:putative Mg2+ transporter-C (MgtC) family protein
MHIDVVFVARLVIATGLGALIGLQRELSGKPAGLRTNLLICLGAALITHISIAVTARAGVGDPARIAAQIVAGIGFLGAGTIVRSQFAVHGLTSAATIWVVAAVGMTVGAGFERQATFAALIVMLALGVLGQVERRYLGPNTLTATLVLADPTADVTALLRSLGAGRQLSTSYQRLGDGAARVQVTWRGAGDGAARLARAAAALPGVTLESWGWEE